MNKTKNKPRILFLEDDQTLAYVTADSLRLKGLDVVHFSHGEEALKAFTEQEFNLCILDIMVPGIDGFSLAEKIRRINQHTPILFLTARVMQEDRIRGLNIGGDDYITKPFSIEELILRIQVFLKRSAIQADNSNELSEIKLGAFTLDHANLRLQSQKDEHKLTLIEADLLKLFFENHNKVLKREDILISVWGDDSGYLSRSLDVFISRLRKLLLADNKISLKNMRSVGFILKYKD